MAVRNQVEEVLLAVRSANYFVTRNQYTQAAQRRCVPLVHVCCLRGKSTSSLACMPFIFMSKRPVYRSTSGSAGERALADLGELTMHCRLQTDNAVISTSCRASFSIANKPTPDTVTWRVRKYFWFANGSDRCGNPAFPSEPSCSKVRLCCELSCADIYKICSQPAEFLTIDLGYFFNCYAVLGSVSSSSRMSAVILLHFSRKGTEK